MAEVSKKSDVVNAYVSPIPSPKRGTIPRYNIENPTKSAVYADYKSLIESNSVEDFLNNKGYSVVSKIIVGGDQCKYVKACNPSGRYVYIELDTEGYINTASVIRVVETKGTQLIPFSMRNDVFDRCGFLPGAVIEYNDNIHILMRIGLDLVPLEITYSPAANSLSEQVPIEATRIYPLLKLSEIKADSKRIFTLTKEACERLHRTIHRSNMKALIEVSEELKALDTLFKTFIVQLKEPYNNNQRKITSLEDNINIDTVSTGSTTRSQLIGLHRQNEDFFDFCSSMISTTKKVQELHNEWQMICDKFKFT